MTPLVVACLIGLVSGLVLVVLVFAIADWLYWRRVRWRR